MKVKKCLDFRRMNGSRLKLSILIFIISLLGSNVFAQNYIVNPDFETGEKSGWNNWNNGVTNNLSDVYKGNWSGYIKSGLQGSLQQDVILKSNTKYRFSAWAKVSKAGETAGFLVINYDGNNPSIRLEVNSIIFQKYSLVFTTGNLSGPVTFSLYKSNAAYGNIYVDNFELIEAGDLITGISLVGANNCSTVVVGTPYQMSTGITPVSAINKNLRWSIENGTGTATINTEGVVAGISEGTAKVRATANDASGISETYSIHILNETPVLKSIKVFHDMNNNTIELGKSLQMKTLFDSEYYCNNFVTWLIENTQGEASIKGDGLLKPLKEGNIKVIATSLSNPTISGELVITVVPGESHNYFVDASLGNDANDGLSKTNAWKSLQKVNSTDFYPGDSILFKSGEVWNGQLEIECNGAKGHPIVFTRYGVGAKPQINGNGQKKYTLLLLNSNYTEVSEFDITNKGVTALGGRLGVYLLAQNKGSIYETVVKNLDIHDVNGDKVKANGGGAGIQWRIEGTVTSRFVDALIQGNHIYDCQRNGIGGSTAYGAYQGVKEYYSHGMKIRENLVERIPGDGIVALGCDGAIVEYNICRDFTNDLPVGDAAAGIWPWNSSDYNCEGTIIQYNYSHDNAGGFLLICSTNQYGGYNNNTIVRYNISINDGFRTWGAAGANFCPSFHITGNIVNTQIYNNTIYMNPKPASVKKQFVDAGNWGNVWPNETYFYNNIFYATEATGFDMGSCRNTAFSHNLYYGPITLPTDLYTINGNPLFVNPGESSNVNNYKLLPGSAAHKSGKIIADNGGFDFFGNPVSSTSAPNIGAFNGDVLAVGTPKLFEKEGGFFSISPNPIAGSMLTLDIKQAMGNATLIVHTLTGKTVYSNIYNEIKQGAVKLNTEAYTPGLYIVTIKSATMSQSLKFIKR